MTGAPVAAADYRLPDANGEMKPALEVLNQASYHREYVNDPERSEYFVPIEWLQTLPLERGVQQAGMFGNQNTVCRPTTPAWSDTVERLKAVFPDYDRENDPAPRRTA